MVLPMTAVTRRVAFDLKCRQFDRAHLEVAINRMKRRRSMEAVRPHAAVRRAVPSHTGARFVQAVFHPRQPTSAVSPMVVLKPILNRPFEALPNITDLAGMRVKMGTEPRDQVVPFALGHHGNFSRVV